MKPSPNSDKKKKAPISCRLSGPLHPFFAVVHGCETTATYVIKKRYYLVVLPRREYLQSLHPASNLSLRSSTTSLCRSFTANGIRHAQKDVHTQKMMLLVDTEIPSHNDPPEAIANVNNTYIIATMSTPKKQATIQSHIFRTMIDDIRLLNPCQHLFSPRCQNSDTLRRFLLILLTKWCPTGTVGNSKFRIQPIVLLLIRC